MSIYACSIVWSSCSSRSIQLIIIKLISDIGFAIRFRTAKTSFEPQFSLDTGINKQIDKTSKILHLGSDTYAIF